MKLINTAFLSFIATSIRIVSGLIINKAIALYIGPSGLAIIGQFQNFIQLAMTAAQGAINGGVTKYTAEYDGDNLKRRVIYSTAAKISLYTAFVTSSAIMIFSSQLSLQILKSEKFSYIFVIFGLLIGMSVANNLLLSIINGLKEIKIWALINIAQSIISIILTTTLIILFGIQGALVALVINQSVVLLVFVFIIKKRGIIYFNNFKGKFDRDAGLKLIKFSIMGITAAITAPVSHIFIRNYISDEIGMDYAGYWQGIWYISSTYLMVVTSTLAIYYLPKLSELKTSMAVRNELFGGLKIIIPIVASIAFGVFLAKDFIINILFSESFRDMRRLFLWQLIGDVIKITAWLFAYLMVAKAMTKTFVITEIFFTSSFALLSVYFINKFGLVGVTYSYALNYFLYLLCMIYITKNEWANKNVCADKGD